MAKGPNWLVIIGIVLVVGYMMDLGGMQAKIGDLFSADEAPKVEPGTDVSTSSCGDDVTGTLYASVKDPYASTLTYYDSTMYVLLDGQRTATTITGASSAPGWGSNTSPCGEELEIVGVTSAGVHASVAPKTITLNKENDYISFEGAQLSHGQVFIKDLTTDSRRYLEPDGDVGQNSSSSFVDLNVTEVFATSAAATDIPVGTDGFIDDLIEIKSGTANKFVTEPDEPYYICVDSGTDNEWQEPSISVNGQRLSSNGVKAEIVSRNPDDATGSYVANSEWCFGPVIGGIDDRADRVEFYIKARSGQDPDTSNDDITISFLGVGRFASSRENTIKEGIYTDASTQALVVSGTDYVPALLYQIS